jgi:hypothetical protein
MTPENFRKAALALPGAEERAHQGHPDFRASGKVFAIVGWPDAGRVKLDPEQQALLCQAKPNIVRPVPGGRGKQGSTNLHLGRVCSALAMAESRAKTAY